MYCTDLRGWQIRKLRQGIAPALGYLKRLRQRMAANHFPAADELHKVVADAESAMARLDAALADLAYLRRYDRTEEPTQANRDRQTRQARKDNHR
jgi:hypothetical protein